MSKISNKKSQKKVGVFLILDGFGFRKERKGNAIAMAKTPILNNLQKNYPTAMLEASGRAVGLPPEQTGNSETGHMSIGAGRLIKQDIEDINGQIRNGKFQKNPALIESLHYVEKNKSSNIHVVGLLTSNQSSHTYPAHLYELLNFYKKNKVKNVYLHLFTDGRDCGTREGEELMEKLLRVCKNGEIVSSIIGRVYGMDRSRNWKRTEKTYDLITTGKSDHQFKDPFEAFSHLYTEGFTDEFMPPTVINNAKKKPKFVQSGDVVVFFNCRSERARQLVKPFVQKDFEKRGGFKRKVTRKDLFVVTFTDFAEDLDHAHVAFPSVIVDNTLPCAISLNGLTQVYMAETEKYAHVTYFLNGGVGKTRCGERRIRFKSDNVISFDKKPSMQTPKIADQILKFIKNNKYDFIVANFANMDMLGHTGNIKATIKGVECVDDSVGKIYKALKKIDGYLFIVGDHGNAEEMLKGHEIETQHNSNPVPFICVNNKLRGKKMLKKTGSLTNVSPTILHILNLKKPKEMTKKSLI